MEDVPEQVQVKYAQIYGVFYHIAQGSTLGQACTLLDIPISTFQSYRSQYPVWMAEAQKQATQDLIDTIRESEHAQVAARAEAQVQINQAVVPQLVKLLGQIAAEATAEGTSLRQKMAAAKLLQEGILGGWTIPPVEPDEGKTVDALKTQAAIDLLGASTIKLPDGREISLSEPAHNPPDASTTSDAPDQMPNS